MPQSTQCLGCDHYQGGFKTGLHCKAFPYEKKVSIPDEILTGLFDHRNAYKGDNGIRYKNDGILNNKDEDIMDMSDQPPL